MAIRETWRGARTRLVAMRDRWLGVDRMAQHQQRALSELAREVRSLRRALETPDKSAERCCPLCGAVFDEYAAFNQRPKALCPNCNSLERHRLAWLYLRDERRVFRRPLRMLHFAPEPALRRAIQECFGVDHVSAIYDTKHPEQGVDIQALPFEDACFDLIYCSHVLEHVPDDRQAMRELHRVCRPDGFVMVMVPVRDRDETYEDVSITEPEQRRKHFGQFDHLRWYGRDVVTRLAEAGFEVEIENYWSRLDGEKRARYGILPEPIFACTKRRE